MMIGRSSHTFTLPDIFIPLQISKSFYSTDKNILFYRYRCLRCTNYSLCLRCFAQAAANAANAEAAKSAGDDSARHNSGHPFERLLRPNDPHPMLVGAPWRPERIATKAKSPPPAPNTLASAKLAARWRLGSSIVLHVAVSSGEAASRCLLRPTAGLQRCWESDCGAGPHWIRLTLRRGMLLDRLELQLPGADAWPKFPRRLALWAGAHPERLALLQRVTVPREAAAFGWVRLLLRPRRR